MSFWYKFKLCPWKGPESPLQFSWMLNHSGRFKVIPQYKEINVSCDPNRPLIYKWPTFMVKIKDKDLALKFKLYYSEVIEEEWT